MAEDSGFFVSVSEGTLVLDVYRRYKDSSPGSFELYIRDITRKPTFKPPITAEEFEIAVGRPPENDDLDRCNCDELTEVGHQSCGWDMETQQPTYMNIG